MKLPKYVYLIYVNGLYYSSRANREAARDSARSAKKFLRTKNVIIYQVSVKDELVKVVR
ncbi:hypothetical protein [Pseudomonas phage K4]|uniref:hypothetical protein n=1 Tax=Pseudomonas phage O4 TaxID=1784982 RepID=UPI00078EB78F|nr:hypothetical protein BJD45_gp48 [Pseudomonas phage O4]AMO43523.1 hypothetical protein O4_48 [Pseudomonas phage O4]ATG86283.1 hypothetical protein [Pseudomonas phage IME180]QWS69980.1 hypothetical protein [Pseudomonas phage K4]